MANPTHEPTMLPGHWEGWRIDRDGLLWAPDTWRNGFTPWQLKALFFECQQIPSLRAENRLLTRDLEHTRGDLEAIQKRAAFYRRQCHFEAKMGLTLLPLRSP
jgi:hypothetical protein